MADEILSRDQNHITVLGGITDDANQYVTMLRVDPTTKRLLVSATGGGGDVVGPSSSTDEAIVRFNGTTGKLIQDYTSGAPTISDTGAVTIPLTSGNSLIVDTTTLVVDATNNRVGIGTAAPSTVLNVAASANPFFLLDGTGVTQTHLSLACITSNGNTNLFFTSTGKFAIESQSYSSRGTAIASTTRFILQGTDGFVGIGTAAPDRKFHVESDVAATNTVTYVDRLTATSTGTPAVGFGVGQEYELENASATNRVAGSIDVAFSDATNATEDATFSFKLIRAGTLTEAVNISSTGVLTSIGLVSNANNSLANVLNVSSANNATITPGTTGTTISRNVADANVTLIVNQINASSTGHILDLQFNSSNKVTFDKDGIMAGPSATLSAPGTSATDVPTLSSTSTLTNKRVNPRVDTVADAATITPTGDSSDLYTVTALGQAATIAAPSGTPVNGQKLLIRLLDNGTARALTWNAIYVPIGVVLPTTTVLSKYTYVGCIYNSASSKWDVIATATQA